MDADAAGRWLLDAIGDAVAEHGVREVHRKLVVLGLEGESPQGFTAALLVDESHVTAHCYSDRGWCAFAVLRTSHCVPSSVPRRAPCHLYALDHRLAIDVFTCGSHDPRPLAESIRQRVENYAPDARCAQHATMRRFLHAPANAALGRALQQEGWMRPEASSTTQQRRRRPTQRAE